MLQLLRPIQTNPLSQTIVEEHPLRSEVAILQAGKAWNLI
jgi:hypothetical protein